MDIKGISKAEILRRLYNSSQPLGLGFLHFEPKDMTLKEAEILLEKNKYFDYLKGRVMKIDLSGDELNTWAYNRDNGEGTAEAIISNIKGEKE